MDLCFLFLFCHYKLNSTFLDTLKYYTSHWFYSLIHFDPDLVNSRKCPAPFHMVATSNTWLLAPEKVASVTQELNFNCIEF